MKTVLHFVLVSLLFLLSAQATHANWPERPVRIVVYTDAGGLIDLTARKLAGQLEQELGQAVIVENKKGAGGLVALSSIINRPADGYTLFGLTSSVISKVVKAKKQPDLDQLHFLARVVKDHECLITREKDGMTSLEQLLSDAKDRKGKQIWAGPASGGTDHLFAQKFWQLAGIEARWVPYKAGSKAIAALLGGHAQVYVGNPQDTAGRKGLRVVAVAAPERLTQFPDVPTFRELGMTELEDEVLWRGFAVRKGTPQPVVEQLEAALRKATLTDDWKQFVNNGSMISVFDTAEDFRRIVTRQIESDSKLLFS